MYNKISIGFMAIMILSLSMACSKPYYKSSAFKKKTADHQAIAILPAIMTITGNLGMNIDSAEIVALEEAESKAFQISMQNEILRGTQSKGKPVKVQIQPITRTNKILKENKIEIRDSWDLDPEDLAKLLGVDAVLISRVEKKKYFSDLAAYGINIGVKLISLLSKSILPLLGAGDVDKTNDIYSLTSLIDGDSGEVLWSLNEKVEADWNSPANEAIDKLNAKVAKFFPYK